MDTHGMNRRDALRALVLGSAGAATAAAWVEALSEVALAHTGGSTQTAAATSWTPQVFSPHQNDTVVTLAELIIPQTETAGATAARVNEFVDTVLADAPVAERSNFLRGLEWMDARSEELFGTTFIGATPGQRVALLTIISSESNKTLPDQVGVEFFQAMKRLTVTGYYTSEVGMREELDDDGTLYFDDAPGCTHPEHKA